MNNFVEINFTDKKSHWIEKSYKLKDKEKSEKPEKIVEETDNLILCLNIDYVHIESETFFLFTKKEKIGDLGTSWCITNDDKGLYDITDINELVQCSSDIVSTSKKGKLCMKLCQVSGSEKLHVLCQVWYANLFSFTFKLLQQSKILSYCKNNIVIQLKSGDIVLDY